MLLKFERHLSWIVTQIEMSLKWECHPKLKCHQKAPKIQKKITKLNFNLGDQP